MEQIQSYRDLVVWRRGMDVTKEVYLLTRQLPKEELFGLTSQMRRAAVSIPSNLAEGHCKSTQSFRNHISIAMGSLAELETQLELSGELYPRLKKAADGIVAELDELNRMLRTLTQRLPT